LLHFKKIKLNLETSSCDNDDWMFETHWEYKEGMQSPRYDLIQYFDQNADDTFNVLDVGCNFGKTLKAVKELYPNANRYGIEIEDKLIEASKQYGDIRNYNIEDDDGIKFDKKFFDIIMLGDVLEHLHFPHKALRNLRDYLKDDGYVLASIPNIGHFTTVINLLNGRFYYGSKDIINIDHLRYFTFIEIIQMFDACGYGNISYNKNILDYKGTYAEPVVNKLAGMGFKTEHMDAYQFLIKAYKK